MASAFVALLAQSVEQLTLNQRVVGSSPTGGIDLAISWHPEPSEPLFFKGFFVP